MNFFLIEDNSMIAEGLKYSFEQNGYNLTIANNLKEAKINLTKFQYNLIILDIMLPDGNGASFFTDYLKSTNIPVLFLTAVDDEATIVDILNNGASEYMTKPFSTKELIARIKKILHTNEKNNILKINDFQYDFDKMLLTKKGQKINLTSLETKILNLLMLKIGKNVSRNILLDKIWQWTGNDVDDHTITVYLQRIRTKIGEDIIVTVKGIGYRIDNDEK